jgi:hypothetical protein
MNIKEVKQIFLKQYLSTGLTVGACQTAPLSQAKSHLWLIIFLLFLLETGSVICSGKRLPVYWLIVEISIWLPICLNCSRRFIPAIGSKPTSLFSLSAD